MNLLWWSWHYPQAGEWYLDGYQFDHDFGKRNRRLPGNTGNPIEVNQDQDVHIQLRWDDAWGGATQDLNIELYNARGNKIAGDPQWNGNQVQGGEMEHYPLEDYRIGPAPFELVTQMLWDYPGLRKPAI